MSDVTEETKATKPSERDKLEQEKIKLAKDIGIWETFNPVENYQDTEQYKRIEEIDKRLAEIIG